MGGVVVVFLIDGVFVGILFSFVYLVGVVLFCLSGRWVGYRILVKIL